MSRYPLLLNSFPVPTVCPQLETDGGATACLYTYLHALALVRTTGTVPMTGHGHRPYDRPPACNMHSSMIGLLPETAQIQQLEAEACCCAKALYTRCPRTLVYNRASCAYIEN